jgi:HEXXH motif-containing protein
VHIEPNRADAARDQASTVRLLGTVLARTSGDAGSLTVPAAAPGSAGYPGLFALAFEAQSARRAADFETKRGVLAARLRQGEADARASARRARETPCPALPVDLTPAERHLEESLARAKRQIPQRADRADALARLSVRAWTAAERAVFCQAGCLLSSVWPEMTAEVETAVRQVALLDGFGIDGFTDFTCHGAVFVNAARLQEDDSGLPAPVRVVEALVHEGTHTRCNAAAVSDPFVSGGDGDSLLVHTPLRNDPRPLNGLFQQLVVIVRCSMLYRRLLTVAEPGGGGAVRSRYETLVAQGHEAVGTMRRHIDNLTEHGASVVEEAEQLLRPATVAATGGG